MFNETFWIFMSAFNLLAILSVVNLIHGYLKSKSLGTQTLLDLLISDLMLVIAWMTTEFTFSKLGLRI